MANLNSSLYDSTRDEYIPTYTIKHGLSVVNSSIADSTTESIVDSTADIPFFDHYFARERIIADSLLASVAFLLNSLAFMTSRQEQHQHYAYYAMFKIMTFSNTFFCLTLWLSNNILVLFVSRLSVDNICTIMSMMVLALVGNSIFGLVSTSSLMGFSLIHYIAVCQPHVFSSRVTKLTVNTGIAALWVIYITLAAIPLFILFVRVLTDCAHDKLEFIELVSRTYMNTAVVIHQVLFLIIAALCLMIYLELRAIQSTVTDFCWTQQLTSERNTFKSILLLVLTFTVFYLPFNIIFIISYNQDTVSGLINSKAIVFYMTLLPYFKFCTDPVLYRKSYMDIRKILSVVFSYCCTCEQVRGACCQNHADTESCKQNREKESQTTQTTLETTGRVMSIRDNSYDERRGTVV